MKQSLRRNTALIDAGPAQFFFLCNRSLKSQSRRLKCSRITAGTAAYDKEIIMFCHATYFLPCIVS